MTTDFRALCAELLDWAEVTAAHYIQLPAVMLRARAALADEPAVPEDREPVAVAGQPSDQEGPSAEDVEELCEEHCFNVEGYESIECLQGLINEAIARWGNPAPLPPAKGEVAELVQHLHDAAEIDDWDGASPGWCQSTLRAADLLQRLSPPQPVPVSERLPGPEDCAPWPGEPNAGRWCWMASCVDNGWAWEQRTLGFLASFPQDFTHWLPAHALPLPGQEAK